jgi:transposase
MKQDRSDGEKPETRRRRRFTKDYRRQVVQETLVPGASVAAIALKHRLNANLVFTWRRQLLPTLTPRRARSVKLLPVTIADGDAIEAPASDPSMLGKPVRRYRSHGIIEIELNGARLVLKGAVDAEALQVVLAALTSR